MAKLKKDALKLRLRKYRRNDSQPQDRDIETPSQPLSREICGISNVYVEGDIDSVGTQQRQFEDITSGYIALPQQSHPQNQDISKQYNHRRLIENGFSSDLDPGPPPCYPSFSDDDQMSVPFDNRSPFSASTVSDFAETYYSTPSEIFDQEEPEQDHHDDIPWDDFLDFRSWSFGDKFVPKEPSA